jgi:catechol 2,3-dioxygenase-like lactoylglutathione lyase family enzyme
MPAISTAMTWDHVHLRSPDPEATAQWFERMFGVEAIRSADLAMRCILHLGGQKIFSAQVGATDAVNAPPVTPCQGLDHFAFAVKDIDAIAAELKAKGAEFTMEPTTARPGTRILFLRGPQGISIELLERDPKYV